MVGIGLGYKDAKRPEKNSRFLEPAVRSCSFLLGFREARTAVHIWSIEMDLSTPPSLQRLAMQSLLSNPSLAISALEDLPVLLFPSLFLEAYATGLTEVLKAMVQAWPFYCLPLGALEESPDLNTFKAVLDGLDLLLAKKERCSHCKLQVLDLRSEHCPDIWTLGNPFMDKISCLNNLTDRLRARRHSWKMEEHSLTIAFDLTFKKSPQNELQTYLVQWVGARKERVQLCSRKLKISSDCISNILMALQVVRLDSIQELIVSEFSRRGTMRKFAPFLGKMRNLQVLHICKVNIRLSTSNRKNSWYSSKFGTYLGQLRHLQELHVHGVFFLYGKFTALFRSLTTLQTLSLSSCLLKEEDLRFLFQATCTKKLKHLSLRSFFMGCFSIETLRSLLEQVAGSLQTLALEECGVTDAQLLAILPILSQCSQLSFFSFFGNQISMATLQILLSHTAQMSHLRRGIYPAPLESYRHEDWFLGNINPERFAQVQTVLTQVLKDLGIAQKVLICTKFFHVWNTCQLYRLRSNGSWMFTEKSLPDLSALPL
ncbi:PRAME family member 8-like [Thomomys bottae]